jgi:WD40 repeat protein
LSSSNHKFMYCIYIFPLDNYPSNIIHSSEMPQKSWHLLHTTNSFSLYIVLIQLWDIRKPDNCIKEPFVAHIGPVFSIDWHSEEPDWLGSAGRDKLIKVSCQMFALLYGLICSTLSARTNGNVFIISRTI